MKKFLELDFDMHALYIMIFGAVLSVLFRQPMYAVFHWIFVLLFLLQSALFSRRSTKWKRFFLSVLITATIAGFGALLSCILRS